MIVKSHIIWDLPQADGRRVIREEHVDDSGIPHVFDYIGDANCAAEVKLMERASYLNTPVGEAADNG